MQSLLDIAEGMDTLMQLTDRGQMDCLNTKSNSNLFAKHAVAIAKIDGLDLTKVKRKLCLPIERDGKAWIPEHAESIEVWYKRYLKLIVMRPDANVVPSRAIDEMWHTHILDTRAYMRDCDNIFGRYIHHIPYFGLEGEQSIKDLDNAYDASCLLFEEYFGESLVNAMRATCCGDGGGCSADAN